MINSSGIHRGEKHCHHMPFATNTLLSSFQEHCVSSALCKLGAASPSLTPALSKLGFQWEQQPAGSAQAGRDGRSGAAGDASTSEGPSEPLAHLSCRAWVPCCTMQPRVPAQTGK